MERYMMTASSFMILIKENQILMFERVNTGRFDGYASIPAGGVERNERFSDCAIRETYEEVNLRIKKEDIKFAGMINPFTQGEEWVGAFFVCTKWSGEVKNNEPQKHSNLRWVNLHNLPKNIVPYLETVLGTLNSSPQLVEYGWE